MRMHKFKKEKSIFLVYVIFKNLSLKYFKNNKLLKICNFSFFIFSVDFYCYNIIWLKLFNPLKESKKVAMYDWQSWISFTNIIFNKYAIHYLINIFNKFRWSTWVMQFALFFRKNHHFSSPTLCLFNRVGNLTREIY